MKIDRGMVDLSFQNSGAAAALVRSGRRAGQFAASMALQLDDRASRLPIMCGMTAPSPLLDRIEQLSRGLLYPSESDFPYTPLCWGATEPTPEAVTAQLGLAAGTRVEVITVRELFEPLMSEEGGASQEEAARYRALLEVFETELAGARALRVGAVDIDIYVLGRDPEGTWLGLKTHAVET